MVKNEEEGGRVMENEELIVNAQLADMKTPWKKVGKIVRIMFDVPEIDVNPTLYSYLECCDEKRLKLGIKIEG